MSTAQHRPVPANSDELIERISQLKQQRGAVILAHNYQPPEIQDMADMLGDSLELARKAAETDAEVIVFCGVHFMAETAAMLCSQRTVLLPHLGAGCPMADMAEEDDLLELKRQYPEAKVVCYVNSSAAVKAHCDICCTSANAVKVVQSLGDAPVIFVPDRNLGRFVESKLGREMILWPGYCPTHDLITPDHVAQARAAHPGVPVVVHPECTMDTIEAADYAESTGGMVRLARDPELPELIVGTETGMLHRLQAEAPHKAFHPLTKRAVCPNMKRIGLEDVVRSLATLEPRITVPESIAGQAVACVDRMLSL